MYVLCSAPHSSVSMPALMKHILAYLFILYECTREFNLLMLFLRLHTFAHLLSLCICNAYIVYSYFILHCTVHTNTGFGTENSLKWIVLFACAHKLFILRDLWSELGSSATATATSVLFIYRFNFI